MESHKCIVCQDKANYSSREVKYLTCQRCLEFTCRECYHDCVIRPRGLFSFREKSGRGYDVADIIVENIE